MGKVLKINAISAFGEGVMGFTVRRCEHGRECCPKDEEHCPEMMKVPGCNIAFYPGLDGFEKAKAFVMKINPAGRLAKAAVS